MLIRVPASTANLGSGFDCVGLALDLYDEVELEVAPGGLEIVVEGEGRDSVPLDSSHLVVRSIRLGLDAWAAQLPGLRLRCRNAIPHSRGLGSSAAAIVAGLAAAWRIAFPDRELDRGELLRLANLAEGHPDNAGAAVYGGGLLAWTRQDEVGLVPLAIDAGLRFRAYIPAFETPTAGARKVLPSEVARVDAVWQATRSAMLPLALAGRSDLLLEATGDRLHQDYRRELMPASYELLVRLRHAGVPAVISGAGPTVLAIGTAEQLVPAVAANGFDCLELAVAPGVSVT